MTTAPSPITILLGLAGGLLLLKHACCPDMPYVVALAPLWGTAVLIFCGAGLAGFANWWGS